jgi:hypothetical protein
MPQLKFYLDLPGGKQFAQNTTYTHELLKYLVKINGHLMVTDISDADYVLISMTGLVEFNRLVSLRKRARDKPIIAGGHAAFSILPLLAYADYVCVGQGFELFRDIGDAHPDISVLPYIGTKFKKAGSIVSSQVVLWDQCPVVQIAKNSYSFLYSIGCRNKCSFCYTSWINKYQVTTKNVDHIQSKIPNKAQLYLISNDYNGKNIKRSVSDATVKQYIATPEMFKSVNLVRFGVEAPNEATRKDLLNKPISDDELREIIKISGSDKFKQSIKMFLIEGLNTLDEWLSFCDVIEDQRAKPPIWCIMNYFEPTPMTPLQDFDLRRLINLDKGPFKFKLYNACRRAKLPDCNIKDIFPIFRSVLSRANYEEVPVVWKMKDAKTREDLFARLTEHGLEGLIRKHQHPNPIIHPHNMKLKDI